MSLLTRLQPGIAGLQIATDEHPWVDERTVSALTAAVDQLAEDARVRAVVVTGGLRHFCSGASLDLLIDADAADRLPALTRALPAQLLRIEVPTVAAMAGHALGGGLMLGLWCDLVVFGQGALYGANFVQLGLTPGMGATRLLAERFGLALAQELLYTGRLMKGRELLGRAPQLAGTVVDDPLDRALALAREIASADPTATRQLKALQRRARRAMLDETHADEGALHRAQLADPAVRQSIASAYPQRGHL